MDQPRDDPPRWLPFALILGLYLTGHGYHSRDGDQAYRLPLLIARLDPSAYVGDSFVEAVRAFNPHAGYLALLDVSSRVVGLSAALAILYGGTFLATCGAVARLAKSCWPSIGPTTGWTAAGLVMLAKAGNIGTNHLFEPLLLDRLVAQAIGWWALALAVERPSRGVGMGPVLIVLAGIVHPSLGLQIGMLLGSSWVWWGLRPKATGVARGLGALGAIGVGLSMAPGAWFATTRGALVTSGMPADDLLRLAGYVQSPQHMIPHLWRGPQWLAWGSYLALAGVSVFASRNSRAEGRARLNRMLAASLIGLFAAWWAIERAGDLRVTLFQPFRLATTARALALVLISGRLVGLWRRGGWADRGRVGLIAAGLLGDWAMVVATGAEVIAAIGARRRSGRAVWVVGVAVGLEFLRRHDNQVGPLVPLAAILAAIGVGLISDRMTAGWTPRRVRWAVAAAWLVPISSLVAALAPRDAEGGPPRWARPLIARIRLTEVPIDAVETLGVWSRMHTPASARFIGPPGPKAFRLWSRRPLAFNRASSPYHAAGLADWAARFKDHVGFEGSNAAFSAAYLADRQGLERGYDRKTDLELAELARRQGATHILAGPGRSGPLVELRREGRYAIYRVSR